jgi:hypothetical protein
MDLESQSTSTQGLEIRKGFFKKNPAKTESYIY